MSWNVINIHEYSTVSDYNYLANQFDGVLISSCYRDGLTGVLYKNNKFDTYINNFLHHTERVRVGYYIRSTAINSEEIEQELAKQDQIINDAENNYPETFVNNFPVFIEFLWTDTGYIRRTEGMTIDYASIYNSIKEYGQTNHKEIGLIVDIDSFVNHIRDINTNFFNYLVIYSQTRPSFSIDAWEYVRSMTITATDKGIDKSTYYTDVADFENLPSNNIGYWITGVFPETYEYNYGNQLIPEAVNPYGLVLNSDYTMTCKDNINAGAATAIIRGINSFGGVAEYGYSITRVELDSIESLDHDEYEYDGKAHEPLPVVKNKKGFTLIRDVDYTVEYQDNINTGTAKVIVKGKNNYIGELTTTFQILGADFYIVARLPYNSYSYTKEQICPKPSTVKHYTYGDLIEGIHYELQYENNIKVGDDAKCVVCGLGNYLGGRYVIPFSIIKADIAENNWIRGLQVWEFTYNGQEHAIKADTDLILDEDYTLEDISEDKISAGVKTVLLTGIGDFTGTLELNYTINQQELPPDDRFSAFPDNYVYRGVPCEPDVVYTPGTHIEFNPDIPSDDDDEELIDEDFGDEDDPDDPPPTGDDDGRADFKDIDDPGYIPPDPSQEDPYWNFGEMEDRWIEVPDPDLVKDVDYIILYNKNDSVGQGELIVQGIGNFTGNRYCIFNIGPATLNPNYFMCDPGEFVYDGTEHKPAIVSFEGLYQDIDFRVTYHRTVNAGTAYALIEGIGDFEGECKIYYTIKPADINDVAYISCGDPVAYNYVYDNNNFDVPFLNGEGSMEMYDDYYYRFETIVYPVNNSYTQTTWIVWGIGNYTGVMEKTFITTIDDVNPQVPPEYRPKIEYIDDIPEQEEEQDNDDWYDDIVEDATDEENINNEEEEKYLIDYDSFYDEFGNHIWHPDKYNWNPEPKIPVDPEDEMEEDTNTDIEVDAGDIDDPNYEWPDPRDKVTGLWNFGDMDMPLEPVMDGDWDFGDLDEKPNIEVVEAIYYKSGTQIALLETDYYSSPVNFYPEQNKLSGIFYIYNYKVYNGRIRVTNIPANVNIIGKCVGWVKLEDILFVGLNVKVGDQVKVVKNIYRSPVGPSSGSINKRSQIMTVVVLVDSTDFNFGDIDTDKDWQITEESYDFGDIDYPYGYPEDYIDEDTIYEYADPSEYIIPPEDDPEPEPEPEPGNGEEGLNELSDEEVEFLDEDPYPLDTEYEDTEDEGYNFNELAKIPNTDFGRYPIGLSNTPNGSPIGYADTKMFTKLRLVKKTLK